MSKFKQGDLVRLNYHDEPHIGVVMKVDGRLLGIDVLFPHRISTIRDYECVEPIDPTTAFLTELQALMRKYDVAFGDYEQYKVWMRIGNDLFAWETDKLDEITPDNIFDYEK